MNFCKDNLFGVVERMEGSYHLRIDQMGLGTRATLPEQFLDARRLKLLGEAVGNSNASTITLTFLSMHEL